MHLFFIEKVFIILHLNLTLELNILFKESEFNSNQNCVISHGIIAITY